MEETDAFNESMKAFAESVEKEFLNLREDLADLRRHLVALGVLPPEEE
jgi:hypothetical protein